MRSERVERSFAHVCETGGARRTLIRRHRRSWQAVRSLHGPQLGTPDGKLFGMGTPRGLQKAADSVGALSATQLALIAVRRRPEAHVAKLEMALAGGAPERASFRRRLAARSSKFEFFNGLLGSDVDVDLSFRMTSRPSPRHNESWHRSHFLDLLGWRQMPSYSGLWFNDSVAYVGERDLSLAQLLARQTNWNSQGYKISTISGQAIDRILTYGVVWNNAAVDSIFDMAFLPQYQNAIQHRRTDGFRPVWINASAQVDVHPHLQSYAPRTILVGKL